MGLNTTPKTWTSPYVVTATDLNTEIRDAMTGIQAAWTAYTPNWTATTTNPAIGNGTLVGRYLQIGHTIIFEVQIMMGSTTTFGTGAWSVSLPVTAARTRWSHLAEAFDSSTGAPYPASAAATSTTTVVARLWPSTAGGQFTTVSATAPFTWAVGDMLTISGVYESA